ncbi:hypothetical protein M0R19_04485 [Candidatus Pacearchaeota archaeon]|jgi:hypothetical protein|nr:hypothetical protein [Candidatus Pacearchaeota archaeon]
MTTGKVPMCINCIHFKIEFGLPCDAFPKGIPDEIFMSSFDHHKPFKGDRGIRFEKKKKEK